VTWAKLERTRGRWHFDAGNGRSACGRKNRLDKFRARPYRPGNPATVCKQCAVLEETGRTYQSIVEERKRRDRAQRAQPRLDFIMEVLFA
jgi:hypothetical protein